MVYAIRFFILLEVKAISKDTPRINEEIRARELRVVGPENEQIGIIQCWRSARRPASAAA